MTDDISLEERKVIYRARRGLKELDVYLYVSIRTCVHIYIKEEPFTLSM